MDAPSSALENANALDLATTPMLKQYHTLKNQHDNCILLFRLGDFYEMFYDDAKVASQILDIVLTGRGKTPTGRIPMCGFPFHSAQNYIAKLIAHGHKVAICEQMEDPALAKGIVKRDVTRIITSGTYIDENTFETRYILSLAPQSKLIGVAFTDPNSGRIQTNQYPADKKALTELIINLPIYECIFPDSFSEFIKEIFAHPLLRMKNITLSPVEDWSFNPQIAQKSLCEHYAVHNLSGFGIDELAGSVASCGALLEYLKAMNKQPMRHMDKISLFTSRECVHVTPAAHRGLEIENLIKTIDYTITALGKRKLRFWINHPLKDVASIKSRQEAVAILKNNSAVGEQLKQHLSKIPDIEKNISRLSCGYTHPKDLLAIRNSLSLIPDFKNTLNSLSSPHILFKLNDIVQLRGLLLKSVNEDMPLSNYEGKVIKKGVRTELDNLRGIQENGRQWLKDFQEKEIKRSGINSLKVGYNKVFGYYIEITHTHSKSVPNDYIRKQTLVNAERFITPALKEYEEKILTAEDKIVKIENEIINNLKDEILNNSIALHEFCETIAAIDTILSLSVLAQSPNYICPNISEDAILDIKDGRHPVVEATNVESFIPNDTLLNCDLQHLIILTGPNMAGKSTYIRQSAILVILAQMGSFIPASSAHVGIVDKIFTRIGAHDDISKGQSTFMVEMNETADILNNMTDRSLVILDEIGRGTSTFDGLSLAWALAEHLAQTKTRTLFATHFHELTALANEFPGVKNYNVSVKEWKDQIIFLHKIIPGSTDDSYGIYVAKLAGIPEKIIKRSKQILTQLELKNDLKKDLSKNFANEEQLTLFTSKSDPALEEIKNTLEALDINSLTPLEALNQLQQLKNKINT